MGNLIIGGVIGVMVGLIYLWVKGFIKALKDPDVHEASKLRMSVSHYKRYKEMSEQIQCIYREEGVNYKSDEKVNDIIMQAPNMNEWRRFSEYDWEKSANDFKSRYEHLEDFINNKQ